jgi:hypothetical protein
MWTSLALLSALSLAPAQAGQLELKNPRFTFGILGQERKETDFLPGDMVVLAFDIEGLKIEDDGRVQYSTSLELFDHKKKQVVFKKDPQQMMVVNTLGGSRVPAIALTNIGTDTEAGDYTMTVEVKDIKGKTVEFGIIRPGFVYSNLNEEEAGTRTTMAPPLAVPGQNLFFHFSLTGYKLAVNKASDKEEPNVEVTMVVQDESGKPVLEKPFTGKATELSKELRELKFIPFQIPIQVNRNGKFKIVLEAKDVNGGKTVTQTFDLRVVEVK